MRAPVIQPAARDGLARPPGVARAPVVRVLAVAHGADFDVEHLAERPLLHQLVNGPHIAVVPAVVVDGQRPPGLARRLHHGIGLGDGQAHGLLDHRVLARTKALNDQRGVGVVRRNHTHHVDVIPPEHLREVGVAVDAGELGQRALQRRGIAVAEGHQLHLGHDLQPLAVHPAPVEHGAATHDPAANPVNSHTAPSHCDLQGARASPYRKGRPRPLQV